jgi:hypothetical protein
MEQKLFYRKLFRRFKVLSINSGRIIVELCLGSLPSETSRLEIRRVRYCLIEGILILI